MGKCLQPNNLNSTYRSHKIIGLSTGSCDFCNRKPECDKIDNRIKNETALINCSNCGRAYNPQKGHTYSFVHKLSLCPQCADVFSSYKWLQHSMTKEEVLTEIKE